MMYDFLPERGKSDAAERTPETGKVQAPNQKWRGGGVPRKFLHQELTKFGKVIKI